MDKKTEAMSQEFQAEIEKLKEMQKQFQKLVSVNGQLDTQLNENMMVKEEFDVIKEDAKVFKQVGDVLIPQSYPEAKMNVENRINYIQGEIKRNNGEIENKEKELSGQREKVQKLEKTLIGLIAAKSQK